MEQLIEDIDFSLLPLEIIKQIIYGITYEYPWTCIINLISMRIICKRWLNILNIDEMLDHLKIPPLHFAAMNNNFKEIIALKAKGYSLLEPDCNGLRAAHYAVATNSHNAMKILKIGGALDTFNQNADNLCAFVVNNNSESFKILNKQYNREWTAEDLFKFIRNRDPVGLMDALLSLCKPEIIYRLFERMPEEFVDNDEVKSCTELLSFSLAGRLEMNLFEHMRLHLNPNSHYFDLFKYANGNTNAYNESGETLLGRACGSPILLPTVKKLLECEGIDVNLLSKGEHMHSPIHCAADNNNISAAKILLELKNNEGNYIVSANSRTSYGVTPIHILVEKDKLYDSYDLFELLLQHGADINIQEYRSRYAPIHYAAQNGHKETLEILINNPKCNVELSDIDGDTAVTIAVAFGRENCLELLLQKRANKFRIDKYGNTLLHIAAINRQAKIMDKLIPHLRKSINKLNSTGKAPLHISMMNDEIPCIRVLLKNGAEVNIKNRHGETPLHFAVTHNSIEVINLLLNYGADINAKNNDEFIHKNINIGGYTSLHYAAHLGFLDVVKELIKLGADIHAKTTLGKTVLDLSNEFNHKEVNEYLTQKVYI